MPNTNQPYLQTISEALFSLEIKDAKQGLSNSEVQERGLRYGKNRIEKANSKSVWRLALSQFTSLLVVILICAGSFSLYLGELRDATIMYAIVVLNAAAGFYQEFKAEKVLEKLKNLIIPTTRVIRDGKEKEISSEELVPGDIVCLGEGDGIPADLRLIESTGFSTNDFILTGESDPQPKSENVVIVSEVELTDQNNCVFMGTTVARGEARGVVFATGMKTAIGCIAQSADNVENVLSPLQREINSLSKKITQITFWIALVILLSRLFFHDSLQTALIFAVGVAAAMVPEGLPAQINVALSLGVGRMAKKKALVKQLSAVEALGSASVIASDKTGTITKNEMTITHCSFDGQEFSITGTGYAPEGEIVTSDGLRVMSMGEEKVAGSKYQVAGGEEENVSIPLSQRGWHEVPGVLSEVTVASEPIVQPSPDHFTQNLRPLDRPPPLQKEAGSSNSHFPTPEALKIFFLDGYLASTGRVNPPDEEHADWYAIGDPTESAFATLAMKAGYPLEEIDREYPRLQLFPFDSDRKRMSIVRSHKGKIIAFAKGGIESILSICTHDIVNGEVTEFTQEEKEKLLRLSQAYASESLRVLAVCYKDIAISGERLAMSNTESLSTQLSAERLTLNAVESAMIFAGFVTMFDPPHEEVREAVEKAFAAHIKLVMITGDNAITARAIASKIGMTLEHGELPQVIEDDDLKKMTDEQIMDVFHHRAVIFSRSSPSDKLRIVGILQQMGEIVAVTGDGVNDTLSLKKADIGVAMGKKGSDVAKEAADMVLLDDNFSSIVLAIHEGRTIYHNLEKTIIASLTANFGELTCVMLGFIGAFFDLPIAISAVQILAVDLVGEILPLTFLTLDPSEKELMTAPPRDHKKHIMDGNTLRKVIFFGFLMGSVGFLSFYMVYHLPILDSATHHNRAMTAAYVGVMLCQFMNILSQRTVKSVFTKYFWSNPTLLWTLLISLGFILAIVYLPFLNTYLSTAPLLFSDWLYPIVGAVLFLAVHEGRKRS